MKAQGWRERYAGYEPGLHDLDAILHGVGKPNRVVLRNLADDGARDWRLASSRPLKPVKRVNGVKGQ